MKKAVRQRRKSRNTKWLYGTVALLLFAIGTIAAALSLSNPATQLAAAAASAPSCEQTYQTCLKDSSSARQCENQWYDCINSKCNVNKGSQAMSCPADPECEKDCQQLVSDTKGILNCCYSPNHQGQECPVKVYHQDGSPATCNPTRENVPNYLNGAGTPEADLIPGFHDAMSALSKAYNNLAPSLDVPIQPGTPLPPGTALDDSGNVFLPPGYQEPQFPGSSFYPSNGVVDGASGAQQINYTNSPSVQLQSNSPLLTQFDSGSYINTIISNSAAPLNAASNNAAGGSETISPPNYSAQSTFTYDSGTQAAPNSCPIKLFIWCI